MLAIWLALFTRMGHPTGRPMGCPVTCDMLVSYDIIRLIVMGRPMGHPMGCPTGIQVMYLQVPGIILYLRSLWFQKQVSGIKQAQVKNTLHKHSDRPKTHRTCFCPIFRRYNSICLRVRICSYSVWLSCVFGQFSTNQKPCIVCSS